MATWAQIFRCFPSKHSLIVSTLISLKEQQQKRQVRNRVCLGLNRQLKNLYPISFLLNDLESGLLGKEVLFYPFI